MAAKMPATMRRTLSGELVSRIVEESPTARLEVVQRRSVGTVDWAFCQPVLALFWFSHGVKRMRLSVDGRPIDATVTPSTDLGLVAAAASLEGEIETANQYRYAVAFIDDSRLALGGLRQSLFAFGNPVVQSGFAELAGKAGRHDSTFELLLEGWSLQTLARLGNVQTGRTARSARASALPPSGLRRVSEFVHHHYASPLSVGDLAAVAGYSERHFARVFRDATGRTPMQFVTEVRIERAKEMLSGGRHPITDVALSCGFSQAQHFSVVFRRVTGLSPRQYVLHKG